MNNFASLLKQYSRYIKDVIRSAAKNLKQPNEKQIRKNNRQNDGRRHL